MRNTPVSPDASTLLSTSRVAVPIKIAFLIDRLNYGGAARQLVVLANALQQHGHAVVVLVFYAGGELERELRSSAVVVHVLNKRGRWDLVRFARHLIRVLREEQPQVLHGYLGIPNLVAILLKPLFPGLKVIWAIRASDMQLHRYGRLPQLLDRLASFLSRYSDLVIANSFAGSAHVLSKGYPSRKVIVIPNGIDTDRFVPSSESRMRFRSHLNVATSDKLVGVIGRVDPLKGHETFFRAAAIVARARSDVRFVCVGDAPAAERRTLHELGAELGLTDRLLWVPPQADMTSVYNGLDVLCLPSYSEGFPNALGEGMACGVPCVTTDVGDCALILARPRFVVPPGDAYALATRLQAVLNSPSDEIARMAADGRRRIVGTFSIANLVRATEHAIVPLLDGTAR